MQGGVVTTAHVRGGVCARVGTEGDMRRGIVRVLFLTLGSAGEQRRAGGDACRVWRRANPLS